MMANNSHEIMGVLYVISAILKSLNLSLQINAFFNQIINPLNNMAQNMYLHIISNCTAYAQGEAEKNNEKIQAAIAQLLNKFIFIVNKS